MVTRLRAGRVLLLDRPFSRLVLRNLISPCYAGNLSREA
jgi:hypothetical protein